MAHLPPHLPRSEADLADWMVYADELLGEGDPFGDFIAHDLALPARPSDDDLAAYLYAAEPWCWKPVETLDAVWALGFVRELMPKFRRLSPGYARPPQRIDDTMAARVIALFESRSGSRVEVLHLPSAPTSSAERRLLAALPPTCTRVVVDGEPDHVEALMPQLPAHVTELELRYADHESVAVQRILRTSATMHVRVPTIEPGFLGDARVGPVDDFGLVELETKRVRTTRPDPFRMQTRSGVVPVRAQLARMSPASCEGLDLDMRRTDGRWFMRYDGRRPTTIGGRQLQRDELVELRDGDVVRQSGVAETFYTHDILARARAL